MNQLSTFYQKVLNLGVWCDFPHLKIDAAYICQRGHIAHFVQYAKLCMCTNSHAFITKCIIVLLGGSTICSSVVSCTAARQIP